MCIYRPIQFSNSNLYQRASIVELIPCNLWHYQIKMKFIKNVVVEFVIHERKDLVWIEDTHCVIIVVKRIRKVNVDVVRYLSNEVSFVFYNYQ